MSTRHSISGLSMWLLAGMVAILTAPPALADDGEIRRGGDMTITNEGGDLVVMGGDVTIDADRTGDVAITGGDVAINSRISGDVGVTGGDVTVKGHIGGDLGVTGGDIDLRKGASVGSDLGVAAGNVRIAGTVGGDAGIAAKTVTVSGTIKGKAKIRAKNVSITDSAEIGGELVVEGPNEPKVAKGAKIGGKVTYIRKPANEFSMNGKFFKIR